MIRGETSDTAPIKLRPIWEPLSVSGLAGQYRYFRTQYPDACVLMQVGNRWLVAGENVSGKRVGQRVYRPNFGQCLEIATQQLASFRNKLKRERVAHVLVAQTGNFKTGFKRRATRLIWRPLDRADRRNGKF